MDKNKKTIIACLLVVLWMILIYALSDQPASQSRVLSGKITQTIEKVIQTITGNQEITIRDTNTRNYAHFFIYLGLSVLISHAFSVMGVKRKALFGFCFCFIYAVLDEIHQIFSEGRAIEISDLFTNIFGIVTGIIIYMILKKIYK